MPLKVRLIEGYVLLGFAAGAALTIQVALPPTGQKYTISRLTWESPYSNFIVICSPSLQPTGAWEIPTFNHYTPISNLVWPLTYHITVRAIHEGQTSKASAILVWPPVLEHYASYWMGDATNVTQPFQPLTNTVNINTNPPALYFRRLFTTASNNISPFITWTN